MLAPTREGPRLERLANRHTLKWYTDEEGTYCDAEDFTARVWLESGKWFFRVTEHGHIRTDGDDKTERQAQICCERWIRNHFNEHVERTFR